MMKMGLMIASLVVFMIQIALFIADMKTGKNRYTPLIILLGSIVVGLNAVRTFMF